MLRMYKGSQLDAQDALLRRQIEVIDLTRLARKVEEDKRRRKCRFVILLASAMIGFVAGYYGIHCGR